MTVFKTFAIAAMVAAASLMTSTAQAEFLGLPNGRSANPAMPSDLSVELGFVTGDLDTADYQNIGARVNYRVSPEIVVVGDIGISEYGNADGTPVGLGILYHLSKQRINPNIDIAARASYHAGEYKIDSRKIDLSNLSLEALISGKTPISANGLGWYANFGYHRQTLKSIGSDSSNEIGIGGGLVLPTGSGEAYVGIDLIDELTFGVGFRYFVK